jgi:eukaryotic-like serine/threonine-protein kinase
MVASGGVAAPSEPSTSCELGPELEAAQVRPGEVLGGKFRVERVIGEGSMGLVVEATNLGLDERVALKFLRREALTDPALVARFAREARASVKIKNDHVARVFDVGATAHGTPFIVMEYLEGEDLATVLDRQRRLEVSDVVDYIIQACEGLAEAHARGVVHRDIKPANLFLARGAGALKQIKVLDFGISKAALVSDDLDGMHHTTEIMGSPQYMSPEQLRSTRDVDARADLWSLGIVLFELLTGMMPFTATDMSTLIAQILHDPHSRLRAVRAELPIELEAVVDKCLSKEPATRFQTSAELAVALLPFAPKRARASVERAVDIARSAGGGPPANALDSVAPPPNQLAEVPVTLPAPADTSVPTLPAEAPSHGRLSAVVWLFAVVLALLGVGFGVFALVARSPVSPAASASASASPPSSASAHAAAPTSEASATMEIEETPPSLPMSASPPPLFAPAPAPRAKTVRPVTVAPKASASAAPRAPESEIRMER